MKSKKKPNILIFNPDQWRGDVLGHMGNPAAATPNLDRLVAESAVSFRNAFCQNPVCTPSRCSFMTGWYPHVKGHRTMHHMLRPEEGDPMLLNILKENGYSVFWGGKNDVVPGQFSKDRYADSQSDKAKYELQPGWHGPVYEKTRGRRGDDTFYSFYIGRMEKGKGEKYYRGTDWMHVMEAINFLRTRPDDKPFCIYLPLSYPHPPYGVEEPFFSAIDRGTLPLRIPAPASWEGLPSILKGLYDNFGMKKWTEQRWNELRAAYYGMCMRSDALFGEILDVLKKEDVFDDTAVFFFSDHGDFTGDYGLVEKTQNTFEDCLTRIPFIVKPPAGIPVKPRVSGAIVELVDFSETVYSLAGIEPGYSRFGKSLLPVISGEADELRDAAFCEGGRLAGETHCMENKAHPKTTPFEDYPYWPRLVLQADDEKLYHTKAAMCRTRKFKYVKRFYEQDELYDLEKDPGETKNLAGSSAYGTVLSDMKQKMLDWYMQTCDTVPLSQDER